MGLSGQLGLASWAVECVGSTRLGPKWKVYGVQCHPKKVGLWVWREDRCPGRGRAV